MKQTSKRARKQGKAERIRKVAREVLVDAGGRMSFSKLYRAVRTRMDIPMRYDLMMKSLMLYPSRFRLIRYRNKVDVALVRFPKKEVNHLARVKPRAKPSKKQAVGHKLTSEEFVLRAIEKLRNPAYKTDGIHSVFSGFNAAFRKYFPGFNPVEEVKKLVEAGVVSTRPVRGGVMIYPGRRDFETSAQSSETLKKMGL